MRKKYLFLIILLVFAINAHAAENLLKNYSFEENAGVGSGRFSDWQTWGGNVYDVHTKENHSGNSSVKFWWEGGIYQQLPVIAEYEYQLTTWLLNPKSEPLDPEGTKFALLELQFVSKDNEILTTNESEPFDCKREIGKWYQLQVNGIAPPNASFVRATVTFIGGEGTGIVCIDDVNLELLGQTEFFKGASKEPFSLDLEGEWLIRKGDNPDWVKSDYDDSKWNKIDVPGPWEILYTDYDGFGWYRLHFKIPVEAKKEPLFLLFGRIDDADEVYLNGIMIGKSGKMPPQFQTAWSRKRQYIIPADIINYGGKNVLAVRVYDKIWQGGIVRRPAKILNTAGLISYFKEIGTTGIQLGQPISPQEFAEWKKKTKGITPSRCKTKKLANGGWTFTLPDGKPFMPVGTEYEPLAIYSEMDWKLVERDLDLIKDDGFNTLSVWCMDYNQSAGTGRKLTIDEIVRLTELAKKKELFIQFYLNIDRFIHLFPTAGLPNGERQGFDIDYFDPGYREFVRNFAKRLAMALYPYDNVSTIVVWEEKVGLVADFDRKDKVFVTTFFGSKAGKVAFGNWLKERHKTLENLNTKWGTTYSSFEEAVDASLLDYFAGAPDNDHRQYDILEFGQIMLIDFTRDFVDAYKSIDPTMLFQCRNWDLFGPVRTIDPRYSFLDSFGLNHYSSGQGGHDISFREGVIRIKLISGITGKAAYLSNFGFRSKSLDGATHGLVPNEEIKASLASHYWIAFSSIPEVAGTSYFTYFFKGPEGPFGIIKNRSGEPLPIYYAFKSAHSLLSQRNEEIALLDYAEKPQVYVFHGLDAIYDVRQRTWIEHTMMAWDLLEMNLNYGVITDTAEFNPSLEPVIIANFHAYDKKLDTDIANKLIDYCKKGGILVIGNAFGEYDRYVWPDTKIEGTLDKLRGIKISELKRGKVKIVVPNNKYNIPDITIDDTYYVEGSYETLDPNAKVLLEMEIDGKKQPALIRNKFGEGTVYYLLFSPYRQQDGWWENRENLNRTSLPILHFLFSEIGISHDTTFGNEGLDLKGGRINIHAQPIHHFISKEGNIFGTYKDEYGEDNERYSGGVIMSDFIAFRGRKINENGWNIRSSKVTSVFGSIEDNRLNYLTLDPVVISVDKNGIEVKQKTEQYKVYNK